MAARGHNEEHVTPGKFLPERLDPLLTIADLGFRKDPTRTMSALAKTRVLDWTMRKVDRMADELDAIVEKRRETLRQMADFQQRIDRAQAENARLLEHLIKKVS